MKEVAFQLRQGLVKGTGFFIAVVGLTALTSVLAQTLTTFSAGDLISSSTLNANFRIAAPEGAVMAFNRTSCPGGWIASDGTNGTRDLRGLFIRGLNDFGSTEGTRADGMEDPDGGARVLGDEQTDDFASHSHSYESEATTNGWGGSNSASAVTTIIRNTKSTATAGGNETRPRNVALIYCERKDT